MQYNDLIELQHETLNANFNGAILTSRAHVNYELRLHAANEDIYSMNICMYFIKNSYLVKVFNEKILQFLSNGFITKFANSFKNLNIKKSMSTAATIVANEKIQLSLDHLYGLFIICSLVYLVAFVVFILEIISLKIQYFQFIHRIYYG